MELGIRRVIDATFDDVLARVPAALQAEGFGVLTEIDVAATLQKKLGVPFRKYRILGACNPALAHEALTANLGVGTMLPCNVVLYEDDEAHTVVIAVDPTQTMAASDPALSPSARAVREKLVAALARL